MIRAHKRNKDSLDKYLDSLRKPDIKGLVKTNMDYYMRQYEAQRSPRELYELAKTPRWSMVQVPDILGGYHSSAEYILKKDCALNPQSRIFELNDFGGYVDFEAAVISEINKMSVKGSGPKKDFKESNSDDLDDSIVPYLLVVVFIVILSAAIFG